jgi:nucleoside-diphosphate-sugar epimerase
MTRSLVTGGFGFIGRFLTGQLLEAGDAVMLLDVVKDDAFLKGLNGDVRAVRGSVANWADVMEACLQFKPDRVFHTGALLPPASESAPYNAFQVNIAGTFNVLEAARLCGVPQVVYASSVASYGPDAPVALVPNDFSQHPTGFYGVSKVCSERTGEYYHRHYGLDFRAVRFPPIFGPGRGAGSGWTAYTSLAVEEPALGRPYALKVDPDTATGILYVRDASRSLIDISNGDNARLRSRAYNIHGYVVTARELADAVRRHIPGAHITFEPDPQTISFVTTIPRQLDDSMAKADWGWQPRYPLDEAIKDFVALVRSRG